MNRAMVVKLENGFVNMYSADKEETKEKADPRK